MADTPYRPAVPDDITRRLREEGELSTQPLDRSLGLTLFLDSDGLIRHQSPAVVDIDEIVLCDMGDEYLLPYIHPADRDRVSAQLDRLLADDSGAVFETAFRLRDTTGSYHWFDAKGANCLDSPPITDAAVIARYIQERPQTDERRQPSDTVIDQLQQTTQRLLDTTDSTEAARIAMAGIEEVFEFSIAGIWLANDTKTRLEPVAMSEQRRSLIDTQPVYSADSESLSWDAYRSQTSMKIDDMTDHPERANEDTPIRSELIVPIGEFGMLNIGSTETDAFSDTDLQNVQLWSNTVESALVRNKQIDRLQNQQTELKRERDRLEDFATMISHDLRNLVNVAHGHLGVAQSRADLSRLEPVADAIERMDDIIDDTLTLAKQGETVDEFERVDIERLATNCLDVIETAPATVECVDEFSILADPDRLAHVFENLFRNSVEHGGADVTVTLGRTDDGFYIADDGPGIPPDDRESVFESGYTTSAEGSGLGLRIVEQIVEAHGWSITVSESDDGGARFDISGVTFVKS
ncbi:MAG: signal transduction histidine kinase [uncultured archaeon A07HN63]|nr:MAG: signal transduction histidine kinase [uncultured archaeon A07HN63]